MNQPSEITKYCHRQMSTIFVDFTARKDSEIALRCRHVLAQEQE